MDAFKIVLKIIAMIMLVGATFFVFYFLGAMITSWFTKWSFFSKNIFPTDPPRFREDGSPVWAPIDLTIEDEITKLFKGGIYGFRCNSSRYYNDRLCANSCVGLQPHCLGYSVGSPLGYCYLCFEPPSNASLSTYFAFAEL
jgi:hypothetical protein